MSYNFIFYKLESDENTILEHLTDGFNESYSRFQLQGQLSNGFNHFIHKAKDKMEFLNDPKYKGKYFYLVTNPFEHIVNNNTENKQDIFTSSKIYFDIKDNKLNIVSRAFYKLWEILMIFDIIPSNSIISAHLAEAPGSFVQSLIFFREKFFKKTEYNKDEHYVISINEEGVPNFKKEFKREYSKVNIYEQDGGDLTNLESINKFVKFTKKAYLVTADGGFNWQDENFQEQEAYKLILGEILTCLKIQLYGGVFIIKFFEIYTDITIKIISLLSALYETIYITKPFTSRLSNSEKYLVCIKFKGIDKDIINKLEKLLENINTASKNDMYLVDILPDYKIDKKLKLIINYSSITLSNLQHININKMIKYINLGNYYGDLYHQYLKEQQNANDFWTSTFFPIDINDMNTVKKHLLEKINIVIENNNNEILNYKDKLNRSI
jgi:23S rRNA U2552 (ribose-2'-O)-methylase RlmE/FtsJ